MKYETGNILIGASVRGFDFTLQPSDFNLSPMSIVKADARRIPLADESVQCVVTSPPYWGLRKYSGEQELVWGGEAGNQKEKVKGQREECGNDERGTMNDECGHEWAPYRARSSYGDPSASSTLEGGKSVGASATCHLSLITALGAARGGAGMAWSRRSRCTSNTPF